MTTADAAHIDSSALADSKLALAKSGSTETARSRSAALPEMSRSRSTVLSERTDAIDRDDFDPVAYINELFPTGRWLFPFIRSNLVRPLTSIDIKGKDIL